ncbi:uncharacterized protein BJ212DRAFT_1302445 [Suillus subaureus]|uniref:Uncharacterized protein n=1 Tax=Suillus subaureus TaxID=48587 RepID=A0A9P7J9F0_9AGAM|nr:uncharacterized protein BJ212DRAFT_1302445 [Suillus subaureus]KAG1809598.1 hypothetical protein BJ212DRAFT_1302445 [Suillus subaureus]
MYLTRAGTAWSGVARLLCCSSMPPVLRHHKTFVCTICPVWGSHNAMLDCGIQTDSHSQDDQGLDHSSGVVSVTLMINVCCPNDPSPILNGYPPNEQHGHPTCDMMQQTTQWNQGLAKPTWPVVFAAKRPAFKGKTTKVSQTSISDHYTIQDLLAKSQNGTNSVMPHVHFS